MQRRTLLCLLLVLLTAPAWGAPSESLETWAKLKVPADSEPACEVTKITGWGPPDARLLLYKKKDGFSLLQGAVVYLKGGEYTAAALPPCPYPGWKVFEVKDVFVGRKGTLPLLFVRAEHMTGMGPTGAQPFSVTWVYKWAAGKPVAMAALTDRIGQKEARKDILAKVGAK